MKIFYFALLCHFIFVKTTEGILENHESDSLHEKCKSLNEQFDLSSSESESSDTGSDISIPGSDILISDSDTSASESDDSLNRKLDENSALPELKITLVSSPGHSEYLNFKQTDGMLANENLPVWTVTKNVGTVSKSRQRRLKLTRKLNVMKELGKFTMYQDPKTNSSAVYFHRRRQFDGIIDYRYIIQGLSIDKIHPGSKTKIRLGENGVTSRSKSIAHPQQMANFNNGGEQMDKYDYEIRNTYGNRLYTGYPEILVIISYDFAQKFSKNSKKSEMFKAIVSYVITLFNGVDMLYSNLKETNIKLNIAGIIIATESDSLDFLKNCYHTVEIGDSSDESVWLNADCAIDKFRTRLYDSQITIPFEFYDLALFLTGYSMYVTTNGDVRGVTGRSGFTNSYETRKKDAYPILAGAIQDNGDYTFYITIAHELAHMMSVLHDMPPLITNEGECCGYIMKPASKWCRNCLSWSDASEKALKLFFSSADCCLFINEPQSLYPPGRRVKLTADEQCQCYGYKSTIPSNDRHDIYCETELLCVDDDDQVHDTVIPMDGTLCYYDKVCWYQSCKKITDFKFSKKNYKTLPGPSKTFN
ncbi:hypothetical protein PV327_006983 [Microctonus hyperodae]|uniref:Peptidase M12B domain-containing protein n=1 Tax=Microctonus hyperodae TaxID=165561 RepID=A0AA39KJ11_MICHY|nr:hypothetical protein PV327_006983 [Microctonus hyperodae]